ncbi:Clp protease N-terminal domain-containing protein [Dactylosporangium sp. NPDC049140]|uniref:Clp protease N-terminal domain-containing protein n=1 Tax=Dactylosporangium sp. NPDC049140 TaxID=3155647 RepID=UPI0033D49AFF
MFAHFTTDARAVLTQVPGFAHAASRPSMEPIDLAQALHAHRNGNAAEIWTSPWPATDLPASPPQMSFDKPTKVALEQSLHIALAAGAEHIGTEHLLAALVRTGPADVKEWLSERGATPEAVDALLTRLAGGLHQERPAETPTAKDRREWKRAKARQEGQKPPGLPPAYTIALVVLGVLVVLALCVWSGP